MLKNLIVRFVLIITVLLMILTLNNCKLFNKTTEDEKEFDIRGTWLLSVTLDTHTFETTMEFTGSKIY